MSYPINYPTPQGANIQIFKDGGSTSDWVKPQGASFVYFSLIGAGGNANVGTPGACAAITNFMCPAFLIPDQLCVYVGTNNVSPTINSSTITYQQKNGTGYQVLLARGGNDEIANAAMASNYFTAMGFLNATAGVASGGTLTGTFLRPGENTATPIYGYDTTGKGFFQTQPIICGTGGTSGNTGGIGCGGGQNSTGGHGIVTIITW